ncbi:MAG: hypothetical protein KGZ67_07455, partial [Hydrogenophaga sp.]|nr:hypothetical protein [Hydrogenophaga sp.]
PRACAAGAEIHLSDTDPGALLPFFETWAAAMFRFDDAMTEYLNLTATTFSVGIRPRGRWSTLSRRG